LSLKFKNQEVGFMPIKRQTLESLVQFGRPSHGRSLEMAQRLKRGMSVNYNKATMLDEVLFKIPTTLGVPVLVHIKVPAVINVHGAVKVTPSPSGSYGSFQVKALLKPRYLNILKPLEEHIFIQCIIAWSPPSASMPRFGHQ